MSELTLSASSERAPRRARGLVSILLALSVVLLLARLAAASVLGFTDDEALFACFALFPQPAYADYPGLMGVVSRWLGAGSAPTPAIAHRFTAVAATALPWLGVLAARAWGADKQRGLQVGLALLFVPELAVGLFVLTPHLLFVLTWVATLALAGVALRAGASTLRAFVATLGVGLGVGVAIAIDLRGGALGAAMLAGALTPTYRCRFKTIAPWLALAAAIVVTGPMLLSQAELGWPALCGLSQRSRSEADSWWWMLALQLVLLGPAGLWATGRLLLGLERAPHRSPEQEALRRMLWVATLSVLAFSFARPGRELASLAPVYLTACVATAHSLPFGRAWARVHLATGGLLVALAWAWFATDLPPRWLGERYLARADAANEMRSWGPARRLLLESVHQTVVTDHEWPVVVGAQRGVCAQAQVALANPLRVPVGCNTAERNDFDRWWPRSRWESAATLLFVYDDRIEPDLAADFPGRRIVTLNKASIRRGSRILRTVHVVRLDLVRGVAATSDRR